MKDSPSAILEKYWGYLEFKGSQEKIITAILGKQDVLALLPTGGGKSVCYQVPALAQDGLCIVVSPLIALIQNQVDDLRKKGIKAIALTGGIPLEEVIDLLDNCMFGNYKFLYLSPERLQQELVQERIQQMNVNLIAIDEAHCISQWGHDFRPAYLECSKLRELLPGTPLIALTATATEQVANDILGSLKFMDPLIVKDSFSRNNISLKVFWEEDKRYRLRLLCKKLEKSAIVYVRTRRLAEELAQFLNANGCTATFYHGGISKKEKEKKLTLWLDDKVRTMVATNAFGMGIDKPDVQVVVHYQIPDCLENYFQEAGRAGRNGEPAEAVLITNPGDVDHAKQQFLSVLPDTAFLRLVYQKMNNYFQVSYGEGNDRLVRLNFNSFCEIYKLNPLRTYNAFQLLDQNSVIALSESFSKKTEVRFLAPKERLFDYFEKNRNITTVAQTILRTYGGIFDFETKINTQLIAKKAEISENAVIAILQQLKKDEIIAFTAQHSDLEITFLVPREDDRTINMFAKKVKERQRIKIDNLEHMISYIYNDKVCRSRQLLAYFGETAKKDCGSCDFCSRKKTQGDNQETISLELLKLLQGSNKTSRELTEHLVYDQKLVLRTIQQLLEDGKIRINAINQYELE